jgi:hypothetical protein
MTRLEGEITVFVLTMQSVGKQKHHCDTLGQSRVEQSNNPNNNNNNNPNNQQNTEEITNKGW